MEDNNKSNESYEELLEYFEDYDNSGNTTNNSSVSNYRNINRGQPLNNRVGRNNNNGYNRSGRNNISNSKPINIPSKNMFRRPSGLMSPKNNINTSDVEGEESESKITEAKRKADDMSEKVVKVKKTITFIGKYKFIIIGGIIAFVIIILFMFLIMAIDLSGDDLGGEESTTSYSKLASNTNGSNNENLWWPIGSSEVTTSIDVDGNVVEFRSGTPAYTSLTSDYGPRTNSYHYGIDLAAGGDVYLIAMADGVITYISPNRNTGYNNVPDENLHCDSHAGMIEIDIKYNNGYVSRYLHVKEESIPDFLGNGTKVYQGQVVGQMGNTGCSTGQHLHYELTFNGLRVNPNNFGISIDNPRLLSNNLNKRSEEILKDSYERSKNQTIDSNDNMQKVCLELKNYYPDNVVAGLMVNIKSESSFNPTTLVIDSNGLPSGGLFQWNAGRLTLLKTKYSSNWTLISNQIEYFRYEISTTEYRTEPILNDTSLSASEVTYQFCKKFERPAPGKCEERRDSNLPSQYLSYVQNGCK